jgi:hypothetical protein
MAREIVDIECVFSTSLANVVMSDELVILLRGAALSRGAVGPDSAFPDAAAAGHVLR